MTGLDHMKRVRDAMSARLGPLYEVHDVKLSRIGEQDRVSGLVTRGHTNAWAFIAASVESMTPEQFAQAIEGCAVNVERLYAKNVT